MSCVHEVNIAEVNKHSSSTSNKMKKYSCTVERIFVTNLL
jgi:hypothetical protein